MAAIGFGLVWLGYGVGLWGYCLAKQYAVTPGQLFLPGQSISWPPPAATDTTNNQTPQPASASPLVSIATSLATLVGSGGSAGGANAATSEAAQSGGVGGFLAGLGIQAPGIPSNKAGTATSGGGGAKTK